MAKMRFAILKEIDAEGKLAVVKDLDGEYFECDQDIMLERVGNEIMRLGASTTYGKKTIHGRFAGQEKLYTIQEAVDMAVAAFDRIRAEIKHDTVRAEG